MTAQIDRRKFRGDAKKKKKCGRKVKGEENLKVDKAMN